MTLAGLAARCRAIRARVESEPMRRPPFTREDMAAARALAQRAERMHREADAVVVPFTKAGPPDRFVVVYQEGPESRRVADLRRQACELEARAEDLVPVQYR